VGRGLEGELTDLESGRIIRERLVPLLRQGDVGGAVVQGAGAIRQALGDPQPVTLPPAPAARPAAEPPGWVGLLGLLVPVLILFSLVGRRRRRRSWWLGPPIFWGSGWGGHGGGRGGFGGGFSGGGGGGFGGGGASGSW
jgi:uncharacterized protein